MALEAVPAGTVSDGNFLLLFVPTIANPAAPTSTELNAAGVKKLTYSVEGGGFKHDVTQNTVTVSRLTLAQQLQYDGTVQDDIELTYAFTNTVGDVIRVALPQGQAGFLVERYAIPNGQAVAAGDIVDVVPFKASLQRKVAPAANTEFQRVQKLNVTGPVQRDVAVV